MTALKIAVTVPGEVIAEAKKQARTTRAKSLSAYITEAVIEKLRREELREILDAMDRERGEPNREAKKWAKRVLSRS